MSLRGAVTSSLWLMKVGECPQHSGVLDRGPRGKAPSWHHPFVADLPISVSQVDDALASALRCRVHGRPHYRFI